MFTASAEINNPITINSTLDYEGELFDVVDVEIEANELKTIEMNVSNNSSETLYYTFWYINNTNSNIRIGIEDYNGENTSSGSMASGASERTYNISIFNASNSTANITLGVLANTSNTFNLGTGMTLVPAESLQSYITLANLGLSIDTTHTPDFSTCSGNSCTYSEDNTTGYGDGTNGIYEAEDDLGTSFYFRGAVTNNYVSFANKTWRIVRINGDGTVRIALNESAGTSSYNSGMSNAYVGYMYGTASSSTYEATHANTNNSTIKTFLDNWYQTNLSSYSSYITTSSIFCNDRSLSSGTGIGSTTTYYCTYTRLYQGSPTPILTCPQDNDKFTVSDTLGNGDLTYPIGLLTADEYLMAGAGSYNYNNNTYYSYTNNNGAFYLYDSSYNYWTMSPTCYSNYAQVSFEGSIGAMNSVLLNPSLAVRPVISLTSSAITGGTGTSDDPFTVG